MWSNANLKNDEWFLKAVEKGLLLVSKQGIVTNPRTGNILGSKPLEKAGGYHRVCFSYRGKSRSIYLHRLVWLVFKGRISKGYQVNHKDGNRSRNCLSNFDLKTNVDNTKHGYKRLGNPKRSGTKHTLSALSANQVLEIRKLHRKGYTQRLLSTRYKVSQKVIFNVVNYKSYKEVA